MTMSRWKSGEPGMSLWALLKPSPWTPSWSTWVGTGCKSSPSWSRWCSSSHPSRRSCPLAKVSSSTWIKRHSLKPSFSFVFSVAFERFETKGSKQPGADLLVSKLTFIGLHLLTICLGVYKINAMGLLPTTTSDMLAFLPHKHVLEYAAL